MNTNSINAAIKEISPIDAIAAPNLSKAVSEDIARKNAAVMKETNAQTLSLEEVRELTAEMNDLMNDLQTTLGFSIREDLNHQVVVQITNRETNELIKQIPSEELLNIKVKMEELTGLIFDGTF